MGTESTYYKNLIDKLSNLNRKEYALFLFLGLQAVVIISITAFTTFTFFESIWHFSSGVRTFLFFLFLLLVISMTAFLVVYPLLKYLNIGRKINYYEKAKVVGSYFPSVKDDLLNAMQLVSSEKSGNFYSPPLIDAAFRNIYQKTEKLNFNSIVSFQKAKEVFYYLSVIVVLCVLFFLFIPGLNSASARLIQFNKEFIPPARFIFEVLPGDAEITKGEDINIIISVTGEKPRKVFLAVKNEEQTEFEERELTSDSLGNYKYLVSSVRSSFRYYAFAEDITSKEYNINVIDRPVIKTFDVTITSPSYSRIPQHKQKDNGNITALAGSIVDFSISSTKELSGAKIIFSDTLERTLRAENAIATGKFTIKGDDRYKLILTDKSGNESINPITYEIKALQDAYPSIEMISPAENVSLSNDNRLPLAVKIQDDYGFSRLVINYRLVSSKYEPVWEKQKILEIPVNKTLTEADVAYVWNLSSLSLAVDDVVSYYIEIFDNDNVSGPKSSKTSEYLIRVPSLDEILARAEDTQGEVQKELKETLQEAEELKKTLEKIDQDLKQDKKEISWDEKEKIEKALSKFEELQERMNEAGNELQKMQQELQQNNLLSKETLEKYMELQKLFEELSGEEMKKAMDRLQKMMEQLNRKDTQQAFEQMKMDEEKFKKSIERTMNLLKRLQVEQKIDEMIKRTEELAKKQEELEQKTKESGEQDRNELSKKQSDISKEMDKLQEEMKKLADKMSEIPDMPEEDMDKAMEELEKQQNEELSEQAKQDIMKNQKQQAMKNQQQLSSNMKKMNQMMQQMQESMMQMNQVQTFTDMMRILDNLLNLSKQQEELRKQSETLDPGSSQFKENMQKQDNIQRNLDKLISQLSELSQKTFAVSPEMGKALGDAKREMTKSLQSMQNRNRGETFNSQGEAMGSLNEAASMMKGSMESMMQGGGQGGMMSMMQQMGQLSQQQMNLNNLTQMLQQGSQGKLSPQQQSELQRLSQQQELIRKSVEQLNKEARQSGESKSLPGSLENIAREMQEIISGMNTQKLDDNLVQKQEKILSRMLDIQRSINERDFEKKRESNTGENIVYESPADLDLSSQKGRDKLRDELNRAVKEGYSKDYESLIRKYYELLQEKRN